jgi:hypothetical protein
MLQANYRAAEWLLCCAAVLTFAGCSVLTPEWRPGRASASDCPAYAMNYCVIDNYGKRCGCARKSDVEAMTGSH